jgi:hypothetical protein
MTDPIALSSFRGVVLGKHPRDLPSQNGVVAQNLRTLEGDLRSWKVALNVATVPGGRQSIYRMGRDVPSDTVYWLSWTTLVDVIRGLNPTDTVEKTVYTGDGVPKWTDNTMALASPPYPTAWRVLGVPPPASAPTIAIHTDGPSTQPTANINVVVTFVTDHDEEGSASPVSNTLTIHPGATIDVSSFPVVPAGSYGINRYRIYVTSHATATDFFAFAVEVATGTSTVTVDTAALGDAIVTTDYDMPPADGHSLTALWQFAAMASGKSVRFCEIGLIYAWPLKYRMLTNDTVIGMGSFDQALLVLTSGRPVLIQGQDPSAMAQQQVPLDQACVSKASIVSFAHGVAWASPDGLFYLSSNGPVNLTSGVMTRDNWQALVPTTIVGAQHEGLYYGSYNDGSGLKAFIIDPSQPDGIVFLSATWTTMWHDLVVDALFVLNGVNIQKWNAGASQLTATFTSKVFRVPSDTSFQWGRVVADTFGQVVRFYCNGALRFTKTVADGKPFRLPKGFSGSDWQFSIDTTTPVQGLIVAETVEEASV